MTDAPSTSTRISLQGAVTVRNVGSLHAELIDALAQHSCVTIDCAQLTDADLSLIQVLIAARDSARRAGRVVQLAEPAAGALRSALEQGGLLPGDEDATAFWLRGADLP